MIFPRPLIEELSVLTSFFLTALKIIRQRQTDYDFRLFDFDFVLFHVHGQSMTPEVRFARQNFSTTRKRAFVACPILTSNSSFFFDVCIVWLSICGNAISHKTSLSLGRPLMTQLMVHQTALECELLIAANNFAFELSIILVWFAVTFVNRLRMEDLIACAAFVSLLESGTHVWMIAFLNWRFIEVDGVRMGAAGGFHSTSKWCAGRH